jgi:hypothetical protein
MQLPFVTDKEHSALRPHPTLSMTPTPATSDITTLGVSNTAYYIEYLSRIPKDPRRHGPRVSIAQDVQTLRNHIPQYPEHTPNL